jgi:endonuclease-3
MTAKSEAVLQYLKTHYAEAKCALHFDNAYQCLIAISLSAQTTDKSVNGVTPKLFQDFPSSKELAQGPLSLIEEDIKSLGLYHTKAKHLLQLGRDLQGNFNGQVPLVFEDLITLEGVGSKTAGVFLLEMASRPAIPVDTHVHRIATRLGYAKASDSPLESEAKLEKAFPKEEWMFLHHALIAFGRNECHAQNPACATCGLKDFCLYFKKNSSIKGK